MHGLSLHDLICKEPLRAWALFSGRMFWIVPFRDLAAS